MVVAIVFDASLNPLPPSDLVANSFLPCELVWLAASAQHFVIFTVLLSSFYKFTGLGR